MLRTYSQILQEDIVCLEDGETAPASEGLVCYTRAELMGMKGLAPEVVRAIHKAKRGFGGRYIGPAPPH